MYTGINYQGSFDIIVNFETKKNFLDFILNLCVKFSIV